MPGTTVRTGACTAVITGVTGMLVPPRLPPGDAGLRFFCVVSLGNERRFSVSAAESAAHRDAQGGDGIARASSLLCMPDWPPSSRCRASASRSYAAARRCGAARTARRRGRSHTQVPAALPPWLWPPCRRPDGAARTPRTATRAQVTPCPRGASAPGRLWLAREYCAHRSCNRHS